MNPHDFQESHGGNCLCGKSLYHEEHFGGDRIKTADAFHADKSRSLHLDVIRSAVQVRMRVVISDPHPTLAGRTGKVSYVENGFCTVDLEEMDGSPYNLPVNVPWRYIEAVPLVVPTFRTQEEADAWLEEHNPIPEPQPRFTSVEEAEYWLDQQAVQKVLDAARMDEQIAKRPNIVVTGAKFDMKILQGTIARIQAPMTISKW